MLLECKNSSGSSFKTSRMKNCSSVNRIGQTDDRHSCPIRDLFVRRRSTYWKRLWIIHFLCRKTEWWEAGGWCWVCRKTRCGREFRETCWYHWPHHEITGPIAMRSISLNSIIVCNNSPSHPCILQSSSWGYH